MTPGNGGAIDPQRLIAATTGGNAKSKGAMHKDRLKEQAINYVIARRGKKVDSVSTGWKSQTGQIPTML
jgi:hypothetical protein